MNQEYRPTEKEAISNLQRYLRQLSYFDDTIPAPPVDGIFGTVTRASLIAFQEQNGLPPTGTANEATWNLLYEKYLLSIEEKSPPRGIVLFPQYPEGYEVYMGEESFLVSAIQHMLIEIGILYDDLGEVTMSGIYDEPTSLAIGEFQARNLLPRTGRVDKRTHDRLVESFDIVSKDYKQ